MRRHLAHHSVVVYAWAAAVLERQWTVDHFVQLRSAGTEQPPLPVLGGQSIVSPDHLEDTLLLHLEEVRIVLPGIVDALMARRCMGGTVTV
jgi:hypothetical protein